MDKKTLSEKVMLLDGAHAEEIRVALTEDGVIQDFESETQDKTQLKGNIYIAEVSRVEPSLQAAFITYGGNRNGFLAFSELHPSFFDIPATEREQLEQELIALAERRKKMRTQTQNDENIEEEIDAEDAKALELASSLAPEETTDSTKPAGKFRRVTKGNTSQESPEKPSSETDSFDIPRTPIHRRYKIDSVLKPGQKIMVQVMKEERGNKGAALTTYFTLPGRYTVMMPNNPMAGGISRKIQDSNERTILKDIYNKLDLKDLMGLIVRTAGSSEGIDAKQAEEHIKNDFKHLSNKWKDLQSIFKKAQAEEKPNITCIHEDGSLIIRALRDMAKDDIQEIRISGKRAYKQAKDYAKSLMPEMTKRMKEHKDVTPIFTYYGVEQQLNTLHHMRVQLPSGGYLVIQPTEALVSVDVNSGRATQGKNIEDTALKTNLEAAEELARQIRLRDLSGLIVVDFIDMEHTRSARQVERLMRKLSRKDRARIQISQLSDFGLMQISRQRLRPSFIESHYKQCEHCNGTGQVHTPAAAALMLLRRLEEDDIQDAERIIIHTDPELVIFILNHKRYLIDQMEANYKYQLLFKPTDDLKAPDAKVELVRMKADGSENTSTIDVTLREQAEQPPEVRYSKEGRKQAREEAKAKAEHEKKLAARKKTTQKVPTELPKKAKSTTTKITQAKSEKPTKADASKKTTRKPKKVSNKNVTVQDKPLEVVEMKIDEDTATPVKESATQKSFQRWWSKG